MVSGYQILIAGHHNVVPALVIYLLLRNVRYSGRNFSAVMPVRACEGVSPIPTAQYCAGFFFYDSEASGSLLLSIVI